MQMARSLFNTCEAAGEVVATPQTG